MSSPSQPPSGSGASSGIVSIPYPDFDPSCAEVHQHKVGVWCSSCAQCGMPWHDNLPFPGSEDPDEVMDGEELIRVGPEDSILEAIRVRNPRSIRILTLIISSRLNTPIDSGLLDAASKQSSFKYLEDAANRIIDMTQTLEEQAERENCYSAPWYHILQNALKWPLESPDELMESFYKPSMLRKDLSKAPVVDPLAFTSSSGQIAHSNTRTESASKRRNPREVRSAQDQSSYNNENESNEHMSDNDGANGNENNPDDAPSDPEDFSAYDQKYAECPDYDLHIEPKNASAGVKWSLTAGQDWNPAQLNKPDCSKFVVFRSSEDDKINEIRKLKWWSDVEWSDPDHISKLNKWRLQLKGRSGGAKKVKGLVWTQKEKNACLKFSKEVIAAGAVKNRSAFFEVVATKMEAYFKKIVQKKGEPLAALDYKDTDEEEEGAVLMKDRSGHTRGGKTINNMVNKSFKNINDLVNLYLKSSKKTKSGSSKEKKSKIKKKEETEEEEKDGEDGGEIETNPSPAKKDNKKRTRNEDEKDDEMVTPKQKKARRTASKKASNSPVPETPSRG